MKQDEEKIAYKLNPIFPLIGLLLLGSMSYYIIQNHGAMAYIAFLIFVLIIAISYMAAKKFK